MMLLGALFLWSAVGVVVFSMWKGTSHGPWGALRDVLMHGPIVWVLAVWFIVRRVGAVRRIHRLKNTCASNKELREAIAADPILMEALGSAMRADPELLKRIQEE